jgi:lycopene cyclase domain-containing protein
MYTLLAALATLLAFLIDQYVTKVNLIQKRAFWTSYAIILPFQLLTNWWLTSRDIVMYSSHEIIGLRIASAPVEDLFFGFALILMVLDLWVSLGRKHR